MMIGFTRKSISTRLTEAGVDYTPECKDREDGLRLVYIIEGRVYTPGGADVWLSHHLMEKE